MRSGAGSAGRRSSALGARSDDVAGESLASVPTGDGAAGDAAAALSDVSAAIVSLGAVEAYARRHGADAPGGDDLAAVAAYARAWAVRLGVEVADRLAADFDAAGVLHRDA